MTQEGETEGYTDADHVEALFKHSAPDLFGLCLASSTPVPAEAAARYALEGAEPIRAEGERCAALGVEMAYGDLAVVEDGYVRHQPDRLAEALIRLHAQRSVRIAGGRYRIERT